MKERLPVLLLEGSSSDSIRKPLASRIMIAMGSSYRQTVVGTAATSRGTTSSVFGGGRRSLVVVSLLLVLLSLSVLHLGTTNASVQHPDSTSILIQNESGSPCDLYWIDIATNAAHAMKTNPPLEDNMQLNTFTGHVFECRQTPINEETGECHSPSSGEKLCSMAIITVPQDFPEGTVAIIDDTFSVTYRSASTSKTEPPSKSPKVQSEITYEEVAAPPGINDVAVDTRFKPVPRQECLNGIRKEYGTTKSPSSATSLLDDLSSCIQSNITTELLDGTEILTFEKLARQNQVGYFENYTCASDVMFSADSNDNNNLVFDANAIPKVVTTSIRNETWVNGNEDNKSYDVMILHDRKSSKVHSVQNFISPDECQAMEDAAKPLLHKATVADGKGGSMYSPNRKAMQAGIKVPWEAEKDNNPIARLSRRVYDYTNHVLGMNLQENGQEDLMSIQYFGRGLEDKEPDRYMPHCDGDCDGRYHKFGTRMATMVLYCTIPEKGGATNFRNAGLHVKPTQGSGTFFAYIDPTNNKMDTGFTEHSGCPVVEGEKKIVTQWIRWGVNDTHPWDSFNTLGLQKTDEDEDK